MTLKASVMDLEILWVGGQNIIFKQNSLIFQTYRFRDVMIKNKQRKNRMKNIYLIGGAMGVGKTTVCQRLKSKLNNSVFLDGDWCWDAHPFRATEETKQMVMQNICFLLNQFIHCSAYDNIIFCWVMHEQSIIDNIIKNIDSTKCDIKPISLICSPETLRTRLECDVAKGLRTADVVERSINRLPLYAELNTQKFDTDDTSIDDIADMIIEACMGTDKHEQ